MPLRCYVKGCKRNNEKDKEHSFFQQPSNLELRKKWQDFAKVTGNPSHLRICSDHFESKCIRKKYPRPLLVRGAIPTLGKPSSPSTSSRSDLTNDEGIDNRLEFQRSELQGNCTHQPKGLILDIEKGTADQPATIHIQTNEKIRIVISDDEGCSTNSKRSLSPVTSVNTNQTSCNSRLSTETSHCSTPRRTIDIQMSPDTAGTTSPIGTPKSLLHASRQIFHTPKITLSSREKSTPIQNRNLVTPKSLRLNTQKRTIAALRSKINRLQRNKILTKSGKNSQIETIINQSSAYLSKEAQTLFATHIRLSCVKNSRKRYSDDFKDIALSILYHSPKAYRFLKKIINLPSERTLREYQKKCPIYVGINETVLIQLKNNFRSAPEKDKLVSLLFDEINLIPEVHFDHHSDYFKGLVDDGIIRKPEEAKTALVAMITWINKSMKQTVGYWFLGKSGNSARTHDIILKTIEKISSIGLIVKAVICDQGPKNQGLLKKVSVTPEKPYFYLKDNPHKIFILFDPPHLLKSLRNNVKEKKLTYRGGTVDWNEVYKVYQLSQEKPLNLIPKITDAHFNLTHFSKMKVSLAAQIFSESMFTAHLVYKTMFPEKFSQHNDKTSEFLHDIDKLFDSLNSRLTSKSIANKMNYAISKDSEHRPFLRQMYINFTECKFQKGSQPPCIKGLLLTINSVLQLADDIQTYDTDILRTRRLNQDPLENLFAIVRQQHGCSTNPSPTQFENGIRQIFITELTKISKMTNCELDENVVFAKLNKFQTELIVKSKTSPEIKPNVSITFEYSDLDIKVQETETSIFTEQNAVYYISGYLCKKFLKNHKCVTCEEILLLNHDVAYEDHKLFTILKQYTDTNALKHTSESVFKNILAWEKLYQLHIKKILHLKGITQIFLPILQNNTETQVELCTPDTTINFMTMFIRIRCHWEARFMRRSLQCGNSLSVLRNKKKMKKFYTPST